MIIQFKYKITVEQFDENNQLIGSVERTALEDTEENITFGKEAPYFLENNDYSAIDLIVNCDHLLIKLGETF